MHSVTVVQIVVELELKVTVSSSHSFVLVVLSDYCNYDISL